MTPQIPVRALTFARCARLLVAAVFLAGCSVSDRDVTIAGDAAPDASIGNKDGGGQPDAPDSSTGVTGDGSTGVTGDGSTTCVPGAPCNPSNGCHEGEVVCSGGIATCRDTDKTKANGSACDQASVCSDGTCTPCAAGAACALTDKPCREGTIVCTTGAAVCTESNNRPNGSTCGTALVCQEGACVACTDGAGCTPATACHVGALNCTPSTACTDTGAMSPPGSACGKDSVCGPDGSCVPCVAGATCAVPGNSCRTGTTACDTGTPICIESGNAANGMSCGTGKLCSGGECVACTAGLSCVPANPCHTGTTTCGATIGCTDTGQPVGNGAACGTDKVCSLGTCSPCAAGTACQTIDACKLGSTSCATGVSVCSASGNKPNGTACGSNQVCASGACIACMQGASCVPPNPCHAGTLACNSGTPTCNDATTALADGTTCGSNLVCRTGACVSCTANATCQPMNLCKSGTTSCTTGSSVCKEGGNKAAGTSCGTDKVCDNTGTCVSCTNGAACTPANACHTGALSCSTGASVCTDSGTARPNGTMCGTNLVCAGGACVSCTAGVTCQPANACKTGTTSCSTGTSTCVEGANKAAGASCGTDMVCNSGGACVACTAGASCMPANPCHKGAISCTTGVPTCVDTGMATNDGTNCGTNLYCLGGNCMSCTPNQTCQPTNLCKNGTTSCASGASTCTETTNKANLTSCGPVQKCTAGVRTATALCNASGQCQAPITNCPMGCNAAGTDCLNCLAGESACNGVCCASGWSCCTGTCRDTTNGANSCGACGVSCASGAVCRAQACVTNASCRTILATGHSSGSGVYTLDPDGPGPIAAFSAYCDMTTNGGGYTLVVGIDAANRNHVSTAAVTPGNLTAPSGKGKFSDAVIRAILSTGSNELKFDVAVNPAQVRTWTAPTCVWDATVAACSNHCGPDDSCIYADKPIGLYMEAGNFLFSYASSGCGGSAATYPGIRNWMGNDCNLATAASGTLWVR